MATFFIATPYPGTDLYRIFEKEGLLLLKDKFKLFEEWMAAVDKAGSNTKFLTAEKIQKLRGEAHSRFYGNRKKKFLNPLRLLRKVHSLEDLKYLLKLASLSGEVLKELSE